jgi:integrase/recombinase XerD
MTQRTKSLPFQDWPAEDRAKWIEIFENDDPFAEATAANLRPTTKTAMHYAMSSFLLAERSAGWNAAGQWVERVTPETIKDWIGFLSQTRSDRGSSIQCLKLYHAMLYLAPQGNWAWLRKLVNRAQGRTPPVRRDEVGPTTGELLALGLELMRDARAAGNLEDLTRSLSLTAAQAFRDGLVIAFLALHPIRRRNIGLVLDEHLVHQNDAWWVLIPGEETKNGQEISFRLKEVVSRPLEEYLYRYRPRLLLSRSSARLWQSCRGPLSSDACYAAVIRRTHKAFGRSVSLHRFRHAAASTLAADSTKSALVARELLGHATFATTEGYYIKAKSRAAGGKLAAVIEKA